MLKNEEIWVNTRKQTRKWEKIISNIQLEDGKQNYSYKSRYCVSGLAQLQTVDCNKNRFFVERIISHFSGFKHFPWQLLCTAVYVLSQT